MFEQQLQEGEIRGSYIRHNNLICRHGMDVSTTMIALNRNNLTQSGGLDIVLSTSVVLEDGDCRI